MILKDFWKRKKQKKTKFKLEANLVMNLASAQISLTKPTTTIR